MLDEDAPVQKPKGVPPNIGTISADRVNILVDHLILGIERESETAAGIMKVYSRYEHGRTFIHHSGRISDLVEMVTDSESFTKMFPILTNLSASSSEATRQEAVSASARDIMVEAGILERMCGFLGIVTPKPSPNTKKIVAEPTRRHSPRIQIMALSILLNVTLSKPEFKDKLISIPNFLVNLRACLEAAAEGKVCDNADYADLIDRATEVVISLCYAGRTPTNEDKAKGARMYEPGESVPRGGSQGRQFRFAKEKLHLVLHDLLLDAVIPLTIQSLLNAIICFMGDSAMRIVDCVDAGLADKCVALIERFQGRNVFGTLFMTKEMAVMIRTCKSIVKFIKRRALETSNLVARRAHDRFVLEHKYACTAATVGVLSPSKLPSVNAAPPKEKSPEFASPRIPALVLSLDPGSADAKVNHGTRLPSPVQRKLSFVTPSRGRKGGNLKAMLAKVNSSATNDASKGSEMPLLPPMNTVLAMIKAALSENPPTYLRIKAEVINVHGKEAFESVKAQVRQYLLNWSSPKRAAVFTLRTVTGAPYVVV